RREVRNVVRVDSVAERQLMADQLTGDDTLVDVDDVVTEPAPVRISGVVPGDDAEPVDLVGRGRRDGQVEPELVRELRARVVELRDAGQQDLGEIAAARLLEGTELRIQLLEDSRENR